VQHLQGDMKAAMAYIHILKFS